MRRSVALSLVVLVTAGGAAATHLPPPQDVSFSGTVSAVSDPDGLLAGAVSIGDPLGGSFEVAVPGRRSRSLREESGPPAQSVEQSDYATRCGNLRVDIGSLGSAHAGGIDIRISDSEPDGGNDLYSVFGRGVLPRSMELPFDLLIELQLRDAGGTAAMRDQALPLPGDLASWDGGSVTLVGCESGSSLCRVSAPRFEIEASVDTLTTLVSDTCGAVGASGFPMGEARFENMKSFLAVDTTPASADAILIRSDGSLRLDLDAATLLTGSFRKGKATGRHVKYRSEVDADSDAALLTYIQGLLTTLGSPIVPLTIEKPPKVVWIAPYDDSPDSLDLEVSFDFDDAGEFRRGKLVVEVSQ